MPVEEVSGSHGLRVRPHDTLGQDENLQLVMILGGGWMTRAEKGAWGEAQRDALPEAVVRLHESGTTVASVCTGGMLLAAAGLTQGCPAVTDYGAVEELRESGAQVVEARVVDDGDLVTAGGVTSAFDLALRPEGSPMVRGR